MIRHDWPWHPGPLADLPLDVLRRIILDQIAALKAWAASTPGVRL